MGPSAAPGETGESQGSGPPFFDPFLYDLFIYSYINFFYMIAFFYEKKKFFLKNFEKF
jgi:hypothetical protein